MTLSLPALTTTLAMGSSSGHRAGLPIIIVIIVIIVAIGIFLWRRRRRQGGD